MHALFKTRVRTIVVLLHAAAGLWLVVSITGLWKNKPERLNPGEEKIKVGLVQHTSAAPRERTTKPVTGSASIEDADQTTPDTTDAGEQTGETVQTTRSTDGGKADKWKARSAEAIRKRGLSSTPRKSNNSGSKQRRLAKLRDRLADKSKPPRKGWATSRSDTGADAKRYFQRLNRYLYQRWEQPAVHGAPPPPVHVSFTIAPDGSIVTATVKKRSGNRSVDKSVIRLLRRLQTVPPFQDFNINKERLQVTVNFKLDT